MLRDEPTLRRRLYQLPRDPLAEEVLIPAFRESVRVRGAFGWFSAGWIPVLAAGLAEYLARGDTKPMQMVVAPALFPEDIEALEQAHSARDIALARFELEMEKAGGLNASVISRHAVACLAWMYANGRLELRIAVPQRDANYHPKVWEFSDGEDEVCVLGSANATSRAFRAAEHMQVECSWESRESVDAIGSMIDSWWLGTCTDSLVETVQLSEAISRGLLKHAPADMPSPMSEDDAHPVDRVPLTETNRSDFRIPADLSWRVGDYAHQGEAVDSWEGSFRRGILEMATGAGKTLTALICAYRTWQVHDGPLLLVISVPSNALLDQWTAECQRFGLDPVLPSREGHARTAVLAHLRDRLIYGGGNAIEVMITTNNLLRRGEFKALLQSLDQRRGDIGVMLIGDEVHTLGTDGFLEDPPDEVEYRLGLSATPDRQYDDEGTQRLKGYFGESVYQFGIDRAIGFCLVPYDYHVHVARLEYDEELEFQRLSSEIGRAAAIGNEELLKRLLIRRRAVLENASAKAQALRKILAGRHPHHVLVYVSAKNPDQMNIAQSILSELRIDATRVTQVESADPSLLRQILASFAAGDIDALIAKRVLDEGVDIPATREAVLMASSTIEREWIQRRGRVLRRSEGKDYAVIHDIVALPSPSPQLSDALHGAVESECGRVRAFARNARNAPQVYRDIEEIANEFTD